MKDTLPDRVRLGAYEADLRAGELRHEGHTTRLQEQPFKILRMLIERDGGLVTRDEIQHKLWPNDTVVEYDSSINAAIKKLRTALGDSADEPRYIETVARRGYRLMVPVERAALEEPAPASTSARKADKAEQSASKFSNGNLIGKKVSHYRVLELLSGGGMGIVYKAEDLKLGRQVALKFLPDETGWDVVALKRFEREARTSSSLDHPNICTLYEVGDYAGQPFLVLQLLQGETLRDRLAELACRHAGLPLPDLLDIAIQICRGMQAAHDKGLVHRDIKPANIFLACSGQVKILDFGLAKLVNAACDAIGTAGYMSPEQIRGEALDPRTDIFSFGLLLYEMASGERAFSGDTAADVQAEILNTAPRPVCELRPELPSGLEAIVSKALEKDREQRYQGAAEMQRDLEMLPAGAPQPAPERQIFRKAWRARYFPFLSPRPK